MQAASDATHEYAIATREQLVSTHVAISPDARTAITCASYAAPEDGSYPAIIHSMEDATERGKLQSGDCITSAAFSPNGQFVVTASKAFADKDGVAPLSRSPILWDAATGQKIRVFSDAALVQARPSMFQRESDRMVLCQGDDAHVVEFTSGQTKVRLRGHSGPVVYAEFSPNGQRILTISEDKTVRVWDSQTGRELRQPINYSSRKAKDVNAQFVASSEALIVCSAGIVELYSVGDLENAANQPLARAKSYNAVPSPAVLQVATFESSRVVVRSSKNLEPICEIELPTRVADVRFHPTDAILLAICGKQMFLCDTETGQVVSELRGHQLSVTDARLAAGSDVLASVSSDKTVRLWHTRSGLQRRTFEQPSDVAQAPLPWQVALSSDDQSIAVGSRSESFSNLRDSSGNRLSSDSPGMPSAGRSDRERLVLVQGNTVTVSESSTSREIYTGAFSSTPTPETQLVDQGRRLLVHTRDFQAVLVDIESNARRRLGDVGETISQARVSADTSTVVLVASDGRFFAIDAATGDLLWSRRHDTPIVDLDLSSDAQTLALLDDAGTLLVWPSGAEEPAAVAKAGQRPANQVQFAMDGERVITWDAFNNQTIRCYQTQDLDANVEYAAEGKLSVSVHPTKPLLGIGTDKQALLWNFEDSSVKKLADRGCRSICLLTDRAAMLLQRTEMAPATLLIQAFDGDSPVYEEKLDLAPICVLPDLHHDHFVVTGAGHAANVFSFQTGKFTSSSAAHATPIILAGFAAAERKLITVSSDGVISVSDNTGNVLRRITAPSRNITAAALDDQGEILVLGSEAGQLILCSVEDGSIVALDGHQAAIRSIRIDSSGNKAVSVAPGEPVRYWNLRTHTGVEIQVPDAVHAEVHGERVLVTAGEPKAAQRKAWLVRDPQSDPEDITQAAGTVMAQFSPGGDRIGLLTPGGRLDVLDADLKVACTLADDKVVRFAFSPNGMTVLTAELGTCTLWSIPKGERVLRVDCSKSQIARLHQWTPFSHDGAWFVTADNVIRKNPCSPVEVARGSTKRKLSDEERRRFRVDLAEFAGAPD